MELLKTLMNQQPELVYMFAVILATYNILLFVFKSPTTKQKILTTIGCGLVLGFIWYTWVDGVELFKLIFALFAAPTVYDWFIKWVKKNKNLNYNNNKGVV